MYFAVLQHHFCIYTHLSINQPLGKAFYYVVELREAPGKQRESPKDAYDAQMNFYFRMATYVQHVQ
jgi:hypothetical protein